MRILVTGASGFIGNYVINYLLANTDAELIATSKSIDKASTCSWFGKVKYVPWTIGNTNTENIFTKFYQPDLCIHLAWDGLPNFISKKHNTIYLENHMHFLNAMIGQGLKKLTVTGTCLEYGMIEGELNESMPSRPVISYAQGKNQLREFLSELQKKESFELDWVRLFYMYGKGQGPKSILSLLAKHIENNEPVFNMSKGDQLRDYLHVKTIAEVIVKLALLNHGNGIVNCCSGKPISIKQLVEDFIDNNGSSIKLKLGYYAYPDYEPFQFWGSTKKLNSLLKNYESE